MYNTYPSYIHNTDRQHGYTVSCFGPKICNYLEKKEKNVLVEFRCCFTTFRRLEKCTHF